MKEAKDPPDNISTCVVWAKVAGFAFWPARLCSPLELERLAKRVPPKPKQQGVLFLGKAAQLGWVNEASICEFSAATFTAAGKFSRQRFLKDVDYKASVIEAIELTTAAEGNQFSADQLNLVQEDPLYEEYYRMGKCVKCEGTAFSGALLVCGGENCSFNVHCRCHKPEVANVPHLLDFYCLDCAKINGINYNKQFQELAGQSSTSSKSNGNKLKKQKKKVSSGDAPCNGELNLQYIADNVDSLQRLAANGSNLISVFDRRSSCNPKKRRHSAVDSLQTIGLLARNGASSRNNVCNSSDEEEEEREEEEESFSLASEPQQTGSQTKSESIKRQKKEEAEIVGVHEESSEHSDTEADQSADVCLLCGEGGHLLLCDFEGCRRAFHHVCVLPTTAHSPWQTASLDPSSECWFCPTHRCSGCGALDEPPGPNGNWLDAKRFRTRSIPSNYYFGLLEAQSQNNVSSSSWSSLAVKPLRSCTSCPLSLCRECESLCVLRGGPDTGADSLSRPEPCRQSGRAAFLRNKRVTIGMTTNRLLMCQNCYVPSLSVKQAVLFEKIWSEIARNRLAAPFLCPFLPGVNCVSPLEATETVDIAEELSKLNTLPYSISEAICRKLQTNLKTRRPSRCPQDLFDVLVRVRQLDYYVGLDDLLVDLFLLRRRLEKSLLQLADGQRRNSSPLLAAFDSLLSSVALVLPRYSCSLTSLETPDNTAEQATEPPLCRPPWRGDWELPALSECEGDVRVCKSLFRRQCYWLPPRHAGNYNPPWYSPPADVHWWEASVQGKWVFSEASNAQRESEVAARKKISSLLDRIEVEEKLRKESAAEVMLAMQRLPVREHVNLLEGMDHEAAWEDVRTNDDVQRLLRDDETIIALDRLKELAVSTLNLQNRLRRVHVQERVERMTGGCAGTASLGDLSLLQELHLSNESLRWKLSQFRRQHEVASDTIKHLQARIASLEELVESLKNSDS